MAYPSNVSLATLWLNLSKVRHKPLDTKPSPQSGDKLRGIHTRACRGGDIPLVCPGTNIQEIALRLYQTWASALIPHLDRPILSIGLESDGHRNILEPASPVSLEDKGYPRRYSRWHCICLRYCTSIDPFGYPSRSRSEVLL